MKNQNKRSKLTPPQTPVFPQAQHILRPTMATAAPKAKKRDNVFSKSKDVREDRSRREMKNAHSAQTFPHVR
ncbi:MAG TPA: hypothetical protein VH255_05360 [Verrucomicrobiae bacterium]|nr:hypothetical protein [Verrucomicrobiae bacterium]